MDSIVDCILTRLIGISIKNYKYAEISSQMENQLREYVSFNGVSLVTSDKISFLKILLKNPA